MNSEQPKIEVLKLATLSGHNDCIYAVVGSHDNNMVYSGAGDGMVVAWNLLEPEMGQLFIKVETSVYALHQRDDLQQLFVGQNFKGIHVISMKDKKEIASSSFTDKSIFDIKSSENKLIVGSGDGQITIFDIADLSILAKLNYSTKSARSIAISQDYNQFAVGYSDNYIRIFDLKTFELIKEINAHKNSVFSVHYSPDGQHLFSTGRDAHINQWDVSNDYQLLNSIPAHTYAINDISFRKDGKYLATSSMDKTIKIWNASTLQLLKVIDHARHNGHKSSVNKIFWSNYHNQLVSCSDDRSLAIWDIKIN